eukprot:6199557-Pleurochrysis_carterae.AAC.2
MVYRTKHDQSSCVTLLATIRIEVGPALENALVARTDLQRAVLAQLRVPIASQILSLGPDGADPLDTSGSHADRNLAELGLGRGSFVYFADARRQVTKSASSGDGKGTGSGGVDRSGSHGGGNGGGSVSDTTGAVSSGGSSRRRGRSASARVARRRTWQQIEDERQAREVKLLGVAKPRVPFVALDLAAARSFSDFALECEFEVVRHALLYGRDAPNGGVLVDVIWEPKQRDGELVSSKPLQTAEAKEEAELAASLARKLGLQRVGWAFCHPPRDLAAVFTAAELVRMCAEAALCRAAAQHGASDGAQTGARSRGGARSLGGGAAPTSRSGRGASAGAGTGAGAGAGAGDTRFVCVRYRAVYEDEPLEGDSTVEVSAFAPFGRPLLTEFSSSHVVF